MGEAEEGGYHAFINHRGPDTKKNVASLIYRSLIKYGLRVFLDQDELETGDPLYDKIKSAISSSSVHVAIFSVRYAESSWCLNELLDMLQSGRKCIPIFYGVKPEDLRHIEKGCYADAFRNHQNRGRHDVELVERWKDALQLASNISGMEFNTKELVERRKDALQLASNISGMEFNTKEDDLGHLVDEIVEKVLKEAKWELLHVAKQPVGLRQAAEDFNNFLKKRQLSGTTVVGIMGLGGSGKSTLVKHLYNCCLQSCKFKRYCFLSELNEEKLAVLQQKMLRDLLGNDKCSISDTTKGKRMLQTFLKGSGPVLIVLDGLDKEEQTESLLLPVKEDVLAEGSLILVTCHDKDLLKCHQVNLLYDVKLLQGKDAHDLFCLYAFNTTKPLKDLEDLVKKFVEICCGFPLALKVLGLKLSVEQDRRYWKKQLKDFTTAKFPINIVENILKPLTRPKKKFRWDIKS